METITIFDVPEKEITITKSQKELEYEQLQKSSKLPAYHFANFYDIDIQNEKDAVPLSNIPSVLCKYLLDYCIPVLTTDPKKYSLTLQVEHPLIAQLDNAYKMIPANQQFQTVSLLFPKYIVKYYDKFMLAHYDHVENSQLATSGHYGLQDLQTMRYNQQRLIFEHLKGLPATKLDEFCSVPFTQEQFKDDASTVALLTKYINYIQYLTKYYNYLYPSLINSYKLTTENIHQPQEQLNQTSPALLTKQQIDTMKQFFDKHYTYQYNVIDDLSKHNLLIPYNMALKLGINNNQTKDILDLYQSKEKALSEYNQQLNRGFSKQLEIAKLQAIALRKFNLNLEELTAKQKNTVQLEYNKLEKYNNNQNETEIQRLWIELRDTFNDIEPDRLSKVLAKIRKSVSKKDLDSDQLIDGVCPHVFHQGEEMLKNFNKPWLNAELLKMLIGEYSLPKDITGYFCKICGERLADSDNDQVVRFVDGERVQNMQQDDSLQSTIWKEAMYTITTYIKFNPIQPTRPLVNSIAAGLRDILAEEEVKLHRSKTSTADSIKDTMNLYISIYVYSVLCAMMIANPNRIIFGREKTETFKVGGNETESPYVVDQDNNKDNNKENNKENNNSNYLPEMRSLAYRLGGKKAEVESVNKTTDIKLYERYVLTTALNLILLTKDAIINRLANMNVEIVKQIFLKQAYLWAKKYIRPIKAEQTNNYDPKIQMIINTDSIYNYVWYALNLDIASHNYAKPRYLEKDDIEKILGRTPKQLEEDIKKGMNIFETVREIKPWSFRAGVYGKLYDQYTYESFIQILDYVKLNIYQQDYVPQTAIVKDYQEKYSKLLDLQKDIKYWTAKARLRPLFNVVMLNNLWIYNDYSPSKINMAQHYCPSGDRHKIGSYLYSADDKKTTELTKNDIIDWLKEFKTKELEEFSEMKIVDERCSKCKTLIRSVVANQAFDKALASTFKRINNIQAFYQYYDSRCPKGELHDIVDHVCKKCGMKTEFRVKTDIQYYDKYSSNFEEINQKKLKISVDNLEVIQEFNKEANEYHKKMKSENLNEEYKYSQQYLAEWSQLSNVKYNVLINIGLTEGFKFEEIQNAVINPTKIISSDNPEALKKYSDYATHTTYDPLASNKSLTDMYMIQSMKIKTYILEIIRLYNMTINHDLTNSLPLSLREILINQKKSGTNIDTKALTQNMPKIVNDFLHHDYKYCNSLNDTNYANFLIEFLAKMMVSLVQEAPKNYKGLCTDLMMFFTNRIIQTEEMYSKPESIYAKMNKDKPSVEKDDSEVGDIDEHAMSQGTESSRGEFSEDDANRDEDIAQDIDNEAFDVENVEDVYELD
jgi:hypothetical protein